MASIKKKTSKAKRTAKKKTSRQKRKDELDKILDREKSMEEAAQNGGPLTKRLLKGFKKRSLDEICPNGVEDYLTWPDQDALIYGYASSMDDLEEKAKAGDRDAFMTLIKIHSRIGLSLTSYTPSLYADDAFYSQDWVQERLKDGFETNKNQHSKARFKEDFWAAIFAWVSGKAIFRATQRNLDQERYIVTKKDEWHQKKLHIQDMVKELITAGYLDENEEDKYNEEKWRKYFEKRGVKGARGRPKNRK